MSCGNEMPQLCTTIRGLVVFLLTAAYGQDTASSKPLQGEPDALAGIGHGFASFQYRPVTRSAQLDVASLAPQQESAPAATSTGSDIPMDNFVAGLQGQEVHTDVMPSDVLGWPPKQAALVPAPSSDSDIRGANGAADYKPALPPDAYQDPGGPADDASNADQSGLPYDTTMSAAGYSTFLPHNNTIDGTSFQLFWVDRMRNPQVLGVLLPRATYWVLPGANKASLGSGSNADVAYHLTLDCIGRRLPFSLDFQGSALNFLDGRKGGIAFKNCSRLSVKGVTMSYPPSQFQFTQGAVVDVGVPPVRRLTVQAHEGYPAWEGAVKCAAYTAGTQVIRVNTSDVFPSSVTHVDDTHYQLQTSYDLYNIWPGDLLACHTGIGGHGVYWQECADSLMTNTTFYNPAGHWIAETACTNMTYSGNHLRPYPSTLGFLAQPLPLMSSIGDGISVMGAHSRPTVVGNIMRGMGGDGVVVAALSYNITGVVAHESSLFVACSGSGCSGITAGDLITAGLSASEPLPGSAKVLMVTSRGQIAAAAPQAEPADTTLEVQLASWPKAWLGSVPTVLSVAPGTGFEIRRNTIANNQGSGIVLQASRGIVANNMITSPKYWGIQAAPLIPGRGDGAFTEGLIIANNTVDAVFGGIVVGCLAGPGHVPCPAHGHFNLTIANNFIQNAAVLPVLVTSARSVSIAGNVFRSVLCYPWVLNNGYTWLPRFWAAIGFVAEATDVSFRDNIIDTSARCLYGNKQNPFQVLSGTVTNLTIT